MPCVEVAGRGKRPPDIEGGKGRNLLVPGGKKKKKKNFPRRKVAIPKGAVFPLMTKGKKNLVMKSWKGEEGHTTPNAESFLLQRGARRIYQRGEKKMWRNRRGRGAYGIGELEKKKKKKGDFLQKGPEGGEESHRLRGGQGENWPFEAGKKGEGGRNVIFSVKKKEYH